MLSSAARVARATHVETRRPARQPAHAAGPTRATARVRPPGYPRQRTWTRSRIVGVELLCVRYLWDDAEYLWLTQRAPDEDRFLSCNLNMSWPDQGTAEAAGPSATTASIVAALHDVFDQMIITTRVVTSRSRVEDDRFAGWLAYSNFDRAWKAVSTLHELLSRTGSGMRQWSRDLFIPRAWRESSRQLGQNRRDQLLGHEPLERFGPAVVRDLLDQCARDVRILAVGHQEDRLDLRVEPVVGQCHPELVLHVGEGAQTAEDHPAPIRPHEVHGQPFERLDRDVGKRPHDLPRHLDSLFDVEERRLVEIDADADDQMVEEEPAAADHVEMTERDRVERAREYGRAIGIGRIAVSWRARVL